jgi:hypothetical protein
MIISLNMSLWPSCGSQRFLLSWVLPSDAYRGSVFCAIVALWSLPASIFVCSSFTAFSLNLVSGRIFPDEGSHFWHQLWRVRVAALITAGSGSLTSIYWLLLNTCNYTELPLLQDRHSTQPIITLSQCDRVFNTVELPWSEFLTGLPNSPRTHQELTSLADC